MAYGIDRAMGNIKKDIFLKKQIEIAKKVLGTPPGMDRVMGGMTKSEARELLKKHGIKYKEPSWPKRLKENNEEIYEKYLSEGYPKTKREIEWDKYLKQAGGDRQKAEEKWNKDHPFKHVSHSEINNYKDLGITNGWKKKPIELVRCEKKLHTIGQYEIGRSYTEYYCPICQIKYRIDSSD